MSVNGSNRKPEKQKDTPVIGIYGLIGWIVFCATVAFVVRTIWG